ncbi:MAG: DNA repair protein RecO, partial [bacterium]|nr:DNA repair protein RecO [bacterium]
MPTYHTDGYVIKRHNLAEADRILTLITYSYGKISAVARSVRKIKSKLAGNLEPFIYSEIHLAKGKNLDIITSVKPKHLFKFSQENLKLIATAYLFMEMIDKLLPSHQPNVKIFDLLTEVFYALEKGFNMGLVKQYFYLKMLKFIGHQPDLQIKKQSKAYYFSLKEGNLTNTRDDLSFAVDKDIIKFWRLILVMDFNQIAKI